MSFLVWDSIILSFVVHIIKINVLSFGRWRRKREHGKITTILPSKTNRCKLPRNQVLIAVTCFCRWAQGRVFGIAEGFGNYWLLSILSLIILMLRT